MRCRRLSGQGLAEDPEATGDDGQPDFPIATGYFRPFCAALLRRAVIIAAFVIAVALGL